MSMFSLNFKVPSVKNLTTQLFSSPSTVNFPSYVPIVLDPAVISLVFLLLKIITPEEPAALQLPPRPELSPLFPFPVVPFALSPHPYPPAEYA